MFPLFLSGKRDKQKSLIERRLITIAQDQVTETQLLAVTGSDNYATFEGGIQACYLTASADCYVGFDEVADTGSLLVKANLQPVEINFHGGNIKKVHAVTSSTANLYILGIRGGR